MKKNTNKKSNTKTKQLCLGEGEHISAETGQMLKHVLSSKEDIEYERTSDSIKFMLNKQGVLLHDEHDRMVFEAGVYHSYNQVEFNPLDQTVSRVFD